jgi:hypothetical protein
VDSKGALLPTTFPDEPKPLPDYLMRHLRDVLHFSDEQIAATSRADAEALIYEHYSRDLSQPTNDSS